MSSLPDPGSPAPCTGTSAGELVAVDFDPDGLCITGCEWCRRSWWAELVLLGGRVQLREWHRRDCAHWGEDGTVPRRADEPLTSTTAVVRGAGVTGLRRAAGGRT
ncbi:hypothetical protein [Solicola sp. PLA-1-18]|uniref:hypothetical protein n=1 Tax=Solicola sp. PLA-1-18 TaxID=3380532 RepID=UPI003B821C84